MDRSKQEPKSTNRLSTFLRSERIGKELSLRDVERATDGEVSNAYLSQLETGKIAKPSPHILYSLSIALDVKYENLMERAGYVTTQGARKSEEKHGRAATFAIDNLTIEEETELRRFLSFIRTEKRK
ncbi:MAG TPA: XRE family transcriptional regulator [Rhodospirillaceae bacterium]|nr:transcriptional regulator [Rhodospirillaceae bacterium]MAX62829.1 transcriptional regulator [Rhodospirillaceae bacterium]MBB57674.1 transcriptional regulator [Rhodospirillaceae bacterium]HAJ21133.1 XRE family transcriptional regulator [Rhodospirillaceae bacterium]HBM13269.1 XRE family transcriptional regulator [Rhodospirillaceae bacterium]|tara:strand:+ start:856 stop:1236 length:381 start_codon:yes stop_codon:yes gene_type:complete